MCSASYPPLLAFCIRTHGEANHLVVPRCLGFLHWLHERPGVLVTLRHIKTRLVRTKHVYASQALLHVYVTPPPHLHMLEDGLQSAVQLIRILQFLPKAQGNTNKLTVMRGETNQPAKLESLTVESHVPFAHRLPASFTCLYEETMNQCHLSHFKMNVRYRVRKIYGALSSQLPMSNVRMPGMLSMGICRTPSLKQESPG